MHAVQRVGRVRRSGDRRSARTADFVASSIRVREVRSVMDIAIEERGGGVVVLRPIGRLDTVSARRLRDAVDDAVGRGDMRVAIDLSRLEFIDSSGLGAVVAALKSLRRAGGDLRVAAPSRQVKLVMQLTNMDRVLPPYVAAETAFDDE